MTVALGKKIFGAIVAVAGFNILLDKHQNAEDVIVGVLVFAAGAAMFAWGFRK
jgi:hypothetical protein